MASPEFPPELIRYIRFRDRLYDEFADEHVRIDSEKAIAAIDSFLEIFDVWWMQSLLNFDRAVLSAMRLRGVTDGRPLSSALACAIPHLLKSPHLSSFGPDPRFCLPFLGDADRDALLDFIDALEKAWPYGAEKVWRMGALVRARDRVGLSAFPWKLSSLLE